MQFCQPHWEQLKKALDDAGLTHLIAKDSKAAHNRMVDELKGVATEEIFDPLWAAHNKLTEMFLKPLGADGLYVLTGDYCPMCELVKMNPYGASDGTDLATNWINGCSESLKQYCESKGWAGDSFKDL